MRRITVIRKSRRMQTNDNLSSVTSQHWKKRIKSLVSPRYRKISMRRRLGKYLLRKGITARGKSRTKTRLKQIKNLRSNLTNLKKPRWILF